VLNEEGVGKGKGKIGRRGEAKYPVAFMYTLHICFCARMYTCLSRVLMVYGIWYMVYARWNRNRFVAQSWNISRQGRHILAEIEYILPSLTPQTLPWFDLQVDAQNSCLFTYNTFIKLFYMFRALQCSSSGGLRRNCIYAASGIITLCRWQLRRRPPEDEQGNAWNM
jgi:hypothetical protein